MEATLEVITRSTHIDGNGHLNNSVFLEYLEWARQDWNQLVRMDRKSLRSLGIGLATVNTNINYKRSVSEGERLKIHTKLEKMGRSSFVVYQQIVNAHGDEVVNASTTRVAINPGEGQSTPIPDEIRNQFL